LPRALDDGEEYKLRKMGLLCPPKVVLQISIKNEDAGFEELKQPTSGGSSTAALLLLLHYW